MKKQYILMLVLFMGLYTQNINAQISDNPIDVLVEKLYQNELLSNRFLRNFAFIKTNTFKKKTMLDMDKSLAKFDDNLSYIILHLPYDRKVKEDFLKLQNFWNIYRLNVTDYESERYHSLILKTRKLEMLIKQLNKAILDKHPAYSRNKKQIYLASLAVDNAKNIDKLAAAYVFKNGLNYPQVYDELEINTSDLKKNLKKIGKYEALKGKADSLLFDLKSTINAINDLINKGQYKPKMMYAYTNAYTKITFKLLDIILKTIN